MLDKDIGLVAGATKYLVDMRHKPSNIRYPYTYFVEIGTPFLILSLQTTNYFLRVEVFSHELIIHLLKNVISLEKLPQLNFLKLAKSTVVGYIDVNLLFLEQHRNLMELTVWDDERGLISEYIAENMNNLQKIRVKSLRK